MGEGERELLRAIRARSLQAARRLRRGDVRVSIGDDAAVLQVRPGEELVVTTDFSLEDVHFRHGWHPPEAVGHKCLARGLSDVAAMGARPVAAFLSLAVPRARTRAGRHGEATWVSRFYDGLLGLATRYRVPLAGGDLAQAPGHEPKAAADIVVLGAVAQGRALLRSGARAGDGLYVTGRLGGAAAELRALERHPRQFRGLLEEDRAEHPHFFPEPRIAAGQELVRRKLATATIDISDGLSVDLRHICEESGVGAEVDVGLLPLGAGATLNDALHGGDDYELLFTAAADAKVPARLGGTAVHRIGLMVRPSKRRPLVELIEDGALRALEPQGWEHF